MLIATIGDIPPVRDGLTDTRRWKLHPSGVFTVKSLYSQLVAENGVPHFPTHFIWQQAIPPNICFLMWCLVHGKLNTIDTLQRKHMSLHNDCAGGEESQNHLFLHCKIAYKIWCNLTPTTGWSWVFPGSMRALEDTWHTQHFSQSGNYIWNLIPAAIVHTIWKERNCRRFEPTRLFKTDNDLILEVKTLVLTWAEAAGHRVNQNCSYTVLSNWEALFL
ncbi:uncharacterized protein LOC113357975 [Papaver somniferum]|uniref:uncharacterized protein LOC113357975 n=1 Tax=Papaver somniferum TaxID=3469 RepID=UPI000E705D1E|nr:uncharacterized protein LOC113357975 [Papaver somniferum]